EVAATVRRALAEEPGDALVFLPGAPEIRRLERALNQGDLPAGTRVLPLHGELPPDVQDAALLPAAGGSRKVVLATSIAETSLTIDGVRIVVDSGQARRTRFDPGSGMSRLETLPVSLAAAEQRRGRAGRLAPGVCYRVYTAADERRLPPATAAEVLEADLAPLALDLAAWGTDAAALAWLDPPPAAHLAQARELLTMLGALDSAGRITPLGQHMAGLGLHPRLARMLLAARGGATVATAARLAALLSERDLARSRPGERDASLEQRLELLDGRQVAGLDADRGALARVRRLASQWTREMPAAPGAHIHSPDAGLLLAAAYPDRIARRRGDSPRYLLANGRGAAFPGPDALTRHEWLVIADLDAGEREARIHLGAPLRRTGGRRRPAATTGSGRTGHCNAGRRARARTRRTTMVARSALPADPRRVSAHGAAGGRSCRLARPWRCLTGGNAGNLAGTLPRRHPAARPPHPPRPRLDPRCRARLRAATVAGAARTHPPHRAQRLASADRLRPRISVRLQEVFGMATTPRVAGGRIALALELLSPAHRPVQVTRDLESFWARGYAEVRKELKGRYPKHYWPDDPTQAEPTARARPRR
ncbi:MAG: helicase-related protein, partial [Proteobacteria bacterium]|nr:helicase-related protein [Pseudomonadota bacterium]